MTQEIPGQKRSSLKVIALALICIVLAASTIGISTIYVNNQPKLSEKDSTIAQLNQQIEDLQLQMSQMPTAASFASQIAALNQQISDLNASLANYAETNTNLRSLLQLEMYATLYSNSFTQDANSATNLALATNTLQYAGYVIVKVESTDDTTYAQIVYSYGDYTFNYNQTVGTSGTALFAVLPSTMYVNIGNLNATLTNSVNATVVYHY